jgi:hypothetical protein
MTTTAPTPARTLAASAALAASLFTTAAAKAQPQPIDPPSWVTVTEQTALRCAPGSIWYPVATLETDTTLRATAIDDGWLRVDYPENTPALALARNATLDADTGTVTITRRTGLRALNLNYPGVETSFKPLFNRDLPTVGTTLQHLATITDEQGNPVAFRVRAPENAAGFVLEDATRPATDAEIERATETAQTPADDTPDTDTDTAQGSTPDQQPDPSERPEAADADQPSASPAQTNEQTPPREPARDEPTDTPDTPTPDPDTADPDTTDPDTAEPESVPSATMGDSPAGQNQTEDTEPKTPRERLDRVFQRLRALDARFNAVREQPPSTTEAAPLIAEYRRLKRLAAPTAVASQIDRHADARIDLLRVRVDIAEALRELEDAQQSVAAADQRLDRLARESQLNIAYAAVGRLAPSDIYDGTAGLPKRYRLQLGTNANTRTVAYIEPTTRFPAPDLDRLIGVRVGINGPTRTPLGTAVPVITPETLEALEPADNPTEDAPR